MSYLSEPSYKTKYLGAEDPRYTHVLWSSLDALDPDQYIIATYLAVLAPGVDPDEALIHVAIENSTGTWTPVKYETVELRDKYGAKIARVVTFKTGDRNVVIFTLGIYAENYNPEDSGLATLLADIAGNAYDLLELENLKLLDLQFPKWWAKAFPGPKFGLDVKRSIGAENRPLVGCIIKPNLGLTPKQIGEIVYELAVGGIDFIKDDEALVNPKYCPIEERVIKVMEAIDRASSETGKKPYYAFNITTDRQDKMMELADVVQSHGGNSLMVVLPYVGYGGVRRLAEDPSIKVPLHVHRCGHGAYTRVPYHGFSPVLVSKLGRMSGADEIHIGVLWGKFHYDIVEARQHCEVLRKPWLHFKPTLPTLSGGNDPSNVGLASNILGRDLLILAGGGILGHPSGTRAGAMAMVQAAEAVEKNIPVEEYAKEHTELAEALRFWSKAYKK
ncbi:MAG: RuBisCO large subunit C-terminal-like domain-containing protein [Desulfurococcaceae archaeon]